MQITKLFSSLLTAFGLGRNEQPGPTQMIDPNSIAFTTPTLSNDLAELEPVTAEPAGTALVFHEDEWTQIEFFPRSQLAEVQRLLT